MTKLLARERFGDSTPSVNRIISELHCGYEVASRIAEELSKSRARTAKSEPDSGAYDEFISRKSQIGGTKGFEPVWIPDFLFDFQKSLVTWAIRKGCCALLEDCGLGKTPQLLVWAENIVRKTNRNVLIVTPLGVSHQTVTEGEKFGIQVGRSKTGKPNGKITVTNYERLHLFDPNDFEGVVCDESSAIKNFEGKRKAVVTEFMRRMPCRLLCTATAAPNDYIELGTSSEALGELGRMDMLGRFFKNDENSNHPIWWSARWRFKAHSEQFFWRWVCSWARAIRKPSDIGFDDSSFVLPPLTTHETIVEASRPYSYGRQRPCENNNRSEKTQCASVANARLKRRWSIPHLFCGVTTTQREIFWKRSFPIRFRLAGKIQTMRKRRLLWRSRAEN